MVFNIHRFVSSTSPSRHDNIRVICISQFPFLELLRFPYSAYSIDQESEYADHRRTEWLGKRYLAGICSHIRYPAITGLLHHTSCHSWLDLFVHTVHTPMPPYSRSKMAQEQTTKKRNPFPMKIAKLSFFIPLISVAISLLMKPFLPNPISRELRIIMGIFYLIFIITALVLGIVSLTYIPKYGRKGI